MLDELGSGGARVFDVFLCDDKTILEITEACDDFFTAKLTKKQVLELAKEFSDIAMTMVDEEAK